MTKVTVGTWQKPRGNRGPRSFSRNMEVVKKGVTAVASAMEYISQAWGTIMDLARHFHV